MMRPHIVIMLTLMAFDGCSQQSALPVPVPETDETAIRACVEGWLTAQEAALPGVEYWDDFIHTSFDDPGLGEIFQALNYYRLKPVGWRRS